MKLLVKLPQLKLTAPIALLCVEVDEEQDVQDLMNEIEIQSGGGILFSSGDFELYCNMRPLLPGASLYAYELVDGMTVHVLAKLAGGSGGEPVQIHPVAMPWRFKSWMKSMDWRAVRRGHQVYTEVFAPCHSLRNVKFRHFSEFMTEKEVKEYAKSIEIDDPVPNMEGEYERRPGRPTDPVPLPYKNEKAAKFSNNGAYPLDLTNMVNARPGGQDYIWSLMCGYGRDKPAGIECDDTVHWNPYFYGGKIAMPRPLSDGMLDYEDGTPATIPQMAKDVVYFLTWTAMPNLELRKITGIKFVPSIFIWLYFIAWHMRWSVVPIKSRVRWIQKPLKYVKP